MMPAGRRPAPRAWCAAGAVLAGLLLAAGCSSAPPPPGQQAAQAARLAAAREYWRMLAVISAELFPEYGGTGKFADCPPPGGGTATQVAYTVTDQLLSLGGQLAPVPFTGKLARLLHDHGWSAFTDRGAALAGTKGGFRLELQPVPGDVTVSARLTFSGPCVTVGAAYAKAAPAMDLDDAYANTDVTASPVPSRPLPAP